MGAVSGRKLFEQLAQSHDQAAAVICLSDRRLRKVVRFVLDHEPTGESRLQGICIAVAGQRFAKGKGRK